MDDAKNENCIKKSILNNVEIRIDALTVSVKPLFYRVFFSSFGTGPDVRFSEAELSDVFESSSTLQAFIATIAKWKCSKKNNGIRALPVASCATAIAQWKIGSNLMLF